MRCDGYGILQTKRSAKKKKNLNLKIKDPESFAAKIIVEYNSSAVSQVHMPISAPWDRQKKKKILNPRVQPLYCPSLGADFCDLT